MTSALVSHPSHAFMPYPEAAVIHASSGPLRGLTFAAKDLFDVAGYPTSGGNAMVLAMSGIKTRTAPAVQVLLDAGAEFVGKTVTDELAFSMNGQNVHFGSPVNGADPRRITGGSSSGSASAVSHGLCDFALGTDTGGSVRAPASHCGLLGLRPTHGRISLDAVWQLCPSFDSCGFFARDIGTFARVADVLLGRDERSLPSAPRLLVADDLFQNIMTAEARAVLAPHVEWLDACFGPSRHVKVADRPLTDLYWAYRRLQGWEAWQSDGPLIEHHAMCMGADVGSRFAFGATVSEEEYGVSRAVQREFTVHLANQLGDDGVLVMPTMPDIAPLADAQGQALEDYRNASIRGLCLAPLAGFPQINLPLAKRGDAPLGLSLLGPRGSDRSLVALAERFFAMRAA